MPKGPRLSDFVVSHFNGLDYADIDWPMLEERYGHKLAFPKQRYEYPCTLEEVMRGWILNGVNKYLIATAREELRGLVADEKKFIQPIRGATRELQKYLHPLRTLNMRNTKQGKQIDVTYRALDREYKRLVSNRGKGGARIPPEDERSIAYFFPLLDDFEKSLIAIGQNIALRTITAHDDVEEWDEMVRWLAKGLRMAGLPAGVKKNFDGNERPSDFTMLMIELSRYFPKECQKHLQSETAMAQAMNRALTHKRAARKA